MQSLQGILADVELLQEITMASREAVGAFVADRTDKAGRVSGSALKNFARLANLDREPYMKALEVWSYIHILMGLNRARRLQK